MTAMALLRVRLSQRRRTHELRAMRASRGTQLNVSVAWARLWPRARPAAHPTKGSTRGHPTTPPLTPRGRAGAVGPGIWTAEFCRAEKAELEP